MFVIRRSHHNPILSPTHDQPWESFAAFNGCPITVGVETQMVYRALSQPEKFEGSSFTLSTIGKASSKDGIHFTKRQQFITPEHEWERYGCEDPRVTKIKNKYYIFYTALSTFPFSAPGIKVAVAISEDMKNIQEKHLVTPFNAKAMALFPEKIKGKYTAILTANTDLPPSKIAIAQFEKEEDMWSPDFWEKWYKNIDASTLHLKRNEDDQVEIGGVPVKTEYGWLVIYSHIAHYHDAGKRLFGIEALLLDLENPTKIIGRTRGPLLVPEESYEIYGTVPNTIFPSGCLIKDGVVKIFYSGTDTVCAIAYVDLENLVMAMKGKDDKIVVRSENNPILIPSKNEWEKRAVFNPAAFELNKKIHIIYRAMSMDNTSVFGYASSIDGIVIKERLKQPIYIPRETFESKGVKPNGNSGCEDPRITVLGDRVYMCYTAYNGIEPPKVALTSISTYDFVAHKWDWTKPVIITTQGLDDKDACIIPISSNGKHLFLHRVNEAICLDYISLENPSTAEFKNSPILRGRPGLWDSKKVGITFPPFLTEHGWILFYHGVSDDGIYRVGIALLDEHDPSKIKARTTDFVFEPQEKYEKEGQIPNVVFPCGAIVRKNKLFIYYGGADTVVGIATMKLEDIFRILLK